MHALVGRSALLAEDAVTAADPLGRRHGWVESDAGLASPGPANPGRASPGPTSPGPTNPGLTNPGLVDSAQFGIEAGRQSRADPGAHEEDVPLRGRWDWDTRSIVVVALVCAALLAGAWAWTHRGEAALDAPGAGPAAEQVASATGPAGTGLVVEQSGMPVAGAVLPAQAADEAASGSGASGAGLAAPTYPAADDSSDRVGTLTVHVVGLVRRPGVYRLSSGARVADAISAAGGVTRPAVLQRVNQARLLTDGEQVRIARGADTAGQPGAGGSGLSTNSSTAGGNSTGAAGTTGRVNLNAATAEQLDALPRVGPVTAQKILQWRSEHGRFASVDQLQEVTGIGEATFAALKPLVTVG